MTKPGHGEPWDRLYREPAAAFQAFTHFVEGHELLQVAKLCGVHRNTVGRWRAAYRWDDRRDALEADRDARLLRRLRVRRRDVVEKHLQLLDAGEALVAKAFLQLSKKSDAADAEELATLPQATRALRHVIDAKRAILGMPTEVVLSREGPPVAAEELHDAAAVLADPALLAEYDRLAARAAAAGRGGEGPVEGDAGGDGREADGGPVAAGAAPGPAEP